MDHNDFTKHFTITIINEFLSSVYHKSLKKASASADQLHLTTMANGPPPVHVANLPGRRALRKPTHNATQVVHPLSLNHGLFSNGLYSESKIS